MKLELHNPENFIDESYSAWRYMSYKKLMSFIKYNEIYFARLDTFQDPLEGLTLEDRNLLSLVRMTRDPNILPEFKKSYENRKVPQSKIRKWQNGLFASCWYLSKNRNDESLAMWDLYTDKDSFALSINLRILKGLVESSLATLDDAEIIAAKIGKIEYLGTYEHSMKVIHSTGTSMPGFIKSPCYQHENELRFMLLRGMPRHDVDRTGITIKLVQSLGDYKDYVNIFTHPDMDLDRSTYWINEFNKLGFNASMSSVLTKSNISQFLSE